MNKMSEDEAIDILKNNEVLQALFNIKYEYKIKQAIETILDLYNKEKEKNSKIQKYVRSNKWAEDYEKSSCRTKILRILEE